MEIVWLVGCEVIVWDDGGGGRGQCRETVGREDGEDLTSVEEEMMDATRSFLNAKVLLNLSSLSESSSCLRHILISSSWWRITVEWDLDEAESSCHLSHLSIWSFSRHSPSSKNWVVVIEKGRFLSKVYLFLSINETQEDILCSCALWNPKLAQLKF